MIKLGFLLVLLVQTLPGAAQKWSKFSSLMGEWNLNETIREMPGNNRALMIRMDGEGHFYPDTIISDRSLKRAGGRLSKWCDKNKESFGHLLSRYGLRQQEGALDSLDTRIEARYIHMIDSLARGRDVVFMIHGYRKKIYGQTDNAKPTDENRYAEKRMGSNRLFVEIYWDSKFISGFKSIWFKRGLKLFEYSQGHNAVEVGQSLRSLVDGIAADDIAIVSHSLGAKVTAELTFGFDQNSAWMDGKTIRCAYLAPAIGHEVFANFNQQGRGDYELSTIIAYNENDFVLNKSFEFLGIRPRLDAYSFGNTALGCNFMSDLDSLTGLFAAWEDLPRPKYVDMSEHGSHTLGYYTRHQGFQEVVGFLFD